MLLPAFSRPIGLLNPASATLAISVFWPLEKTPVTDPSPLMLEALQAAGGIPVRALDVGRLRPAERVIVLKSMVDRGGAVRQRRRGPCTGVPVSWPVTGSKARVAVGSEKVPPGSFASVTVAV